MREDDRLRSTGPAVMCATWSSEMRALSLLTISETFDGSVSGLTLNSTMCSMI